MTTRRTPSTRLGRRLADEARAAVPDTTDLWPMIADRLPRAAQAIRRTRHWLGQALQLSGAVAAVIVLGLALARLFEPGAEPTAATQPPTVGMTPSLATPTPVPAPPDVPVVGDIVATIPVGAAPARLLATA